MKVAALDLGTNSFLCLIAEVEDGRIVRILSDEVQIVRLGQEVDKTRRFHPDAISRARRCLSDFKKTIDFHQPDKVLAMATSAARDVTNGADLFDIGNELGIPVQIIPGDLEAAITFQGAISGLPLDHKKRVVVDIGGGSTEIIAGDLEKVIDGESVDVGAVRLTEMFFPRQPPTQDQIRQFQKHLNAKLDPLISRIKKLGVQEVIAVAGTPTELAASTLGGFDPAQIDGYHMTQSELQAWVSKLSQTSAAERVSQFQISKGRSDVILAGVLILEKIRVGMEVPHLTVSTRGVRFGVALQLANNR